MTEQFLSDDRATVLRRLLYVVLGFAVVLVVLGLPLVFGDYQFYGSLVLGIAIVVGVLGWLTLGAVRAGAPGARRLCIATGAVTIVLSVPLVPIWIGLLTVITGIGVLVITFAPEHKAT
jgi:hypothetical protein